MTLLDAPARRRALTDLDVTLLVEAAAGTGKTALMAGRAAMLLAAGVAPGQVAAITFTELAAGELAIRIRQFIEALAAGETPEVLRLALPDGPSPAQAENLRAALARLDELTCSTIHGFCQGLIQAYAVEADLDPGAQVMDAVQADAMFDRVFSRWLNLRLSAEGGHDGDPIGILAADDPLGVVATLRELADLRRRHLSAHPPQVDLGLRPDIDFVDAVDEFARWFAGAPPEPETVEIVGQLQDLAAFYSGALASPPSFGELWRLTRPPRQEAIMKARSRDWRAYACRGGWRRIAGGEAGVALDGEAELRYDACRIAFAHLIGQMAGAMVSALSGALDEALADYGREKRAAAVLDFDDLLARACDLVRSHDAVRRAIGARYAHIFVDEFQDTDPVQAEIIFALATDEVAAPWTASRVRPGALFLVGDPKQAIYRFRGAHVGAYGAVRDALQAADPESVLRVTANFRSAPAILEHVNACFAAPLERPQQPGYVALAATVAAPADGRTCVAKLTVETMPDANAATQRDDEAVAVADLCRRLVGSFEVRRADGSSSPLRPGDVALLAPTGTDLWRYERELEAVRLSVASQAGRSLMLRQETQDFLALARVLADAADTLAFGALMRGPLVGLTEAQLLAIAGALPLGVDGEPARFTVASDAAEIADPVACEVLLGLQALRRRAVGLTPAALLSEAVERLRIRVALTLRTGDRSARALANLDALLQRARGYAVRGLEAFVADLQSDWDARRMVGEGRVDESEDAIALVTIHSAKGLEWPVVIPINTATQLRGPDQFAHRQSDDSLHWIVGGVLPPELADAQAEEAQSAARERERLWYVACTRARDLLVLPHLPAARDGTWSRIVDLGLGRLPEVQVAAAPPAARPTPPQNDQTAQVFEAQGARVSAAAPPLTWVRPSDHDGDRAATLEVAGQAVEDEIEMPAPVGAGRVRGLILHKLMEEFLDGLLAEDVEAVTTRAAQLTGQLASLEALASSDVPDAAECARTALRTLSLPDILALRPRLLAEAPIWHQRDGGVLVAGRADAVAVDDGRVSVVLDWKSDLAPTDAERAGYASQLATYMDAVGAPRGALVFMSRGEVTWVGAEPGRAP